MAFLFVVVSRLPCLELDASEGGTFQAPVVNAALNQFLEREADWVEIKKNRLRISEDKKLLVTGAFLFGLRTRGRREREIENPAMLGFRSSSPRARVRHILREGRRITHHGDNPRH